MSAITVQAYKLQLYLDSSGVKRADPRSKYQHMCIAISISYLKIHGDISIFFL